MGYPQRDRAAPIADLVSAGKDSYWLVGQDGVRLALYARANIAWLRHSEAGSPFSILFRSSA